MIQARMLSTRLRGKSLIAVAGVPLLYRVIGAVKKFDFIDEIMVATTKAEADDPIAAAALNLGIGIYRGDSSNVLKRFRDASVDLEEEDIVIRFTADNPFYEATISRQVYQEHIKNDNDYTHIDGLSHVVPEFIKVRALREVFSLAREPFDQEHVTPFLRKHSDKFKVQKLPSDFGGLRQDLDKWLTIDSREDLERFEKLLDEIGQQDEVSIVEIYNWLDNKSQKYRATEDYQFLALGNSRIGEGYPTFIVGEIGQNHNGDMEIAKSLIDMAARCGVDAVKFQKRDIDSELTTKAFNRPYESPNSFGSTYGQHRRFLELDEEQHKILKEYARAQGITYFCTPCDSASVEILERIDVPFYKVASRDLTNIPLLEDLARTEKPIIISTGMASLADIDDAVSTLRNNEIVILQCTSQYPTQLENVNLRAMDVLRDRYKKVVGFSDHTPGIIASVAASVLGAAIIEKHITLSRAMKGSDHAGSLEENGLRLLVKYIRETEKMQGGLVKEMIPEVESTKVKLGRSIASSKDLKKGSKLCEDMICLRSPGDGILWRDRNKILGKIILKDIPANTTLCLEDFQQ